MSKTLIEDLKEYADSIDSDINTINNFDVACCDARELEVLQNVFDQLVKMCAKHERERKDK